LSFFFFVSLHARALQPFTTTSMLDKKRKLKAKHEWVEKTLVENGGSSQSDNTQESSMGKGIVEPTSFDILLDMPADEDANEETAVEAKSESDRENSEVSKRRKIERSSQDNGMKRTVAMAYMARHSG